MRTIIAKDTDENFEKILLQASDDLKSGALVVFPTETVFGLGANAFDNQACKKIYEAKGRPSDNPLIVHVSDFNMVKDLVVEYDERFVKLANKFWPGPISFVLKKSSKVCSVVSAGLETVAVRMPNNKIALELISKAGVPVAAPSANISGRPSPTRSEHVIYDLNGRVDYMLCSDNYPIGLESTVLDLSSDKIYILRPGAISKSMIEKELGIEVFYSSEHGSLNSEKNNDDKFIPKAPGMKYKHYSPKAQVVMVEEDFDKSSIKAFSKNYSVSEDEILYLEYKSDIDMAENLFADFRSADSEGYSLILVKAFRSGELLAANMNRLKKACGK